LAALLAACVFFADVFLRRVAVSFQWVARSAAWVTQQLRGRRDAALESQLERLRTSKAAVAKKMEERRAAARLETPTTPDLVPDDEGATELEQVVEETTGKRHTPEEPAPKPTEAEGTEPEGSYTDRLLEAKRRVWKDKNP
jgi:hypothetical protein